MEESVQHKRVALPPQFSLGAHLLLSNGPLAGLAILVTSERVVVQGESMAPSIVPGEHILVSALTYRLRSPQRGDIVLLHDPWGQKRDYLKRIVGLPGEEVVMDEGHVSVDGVPLPEPYRSRGAGRPSYGDWQVGPDEYLVMGDNREASQDGRLFGPVRRDRIAGRAWLHYWPESVRRL